MHIQELILDGFKSYPVRTPITGWDPSFNAITGLNGSGKSNILDAICFVLGLTNMSSVSYASTLVDSALVCLRQQSKDTLGREGTWCLSGTQSSVLETDLSPCMDAIDACAKPARPDIQAWPGGRNQS